MTKQTHDFKAALDRADVECKDHNNVNEDLRLWQAIQTALRIADRLQRGDVSEEMCLQGFSHFNGAYHTRPIFKAMAAQLIKEEN